MMSLLRRRMMMVAQEKIITGVNLINFDETIQGYVINSNTGDLIPNTAWSVTNYIEIDSANTYELTAGGRVRYGLYDENMVFIVASENTATIKILINDKSNARYIRISYVSEYEDALIFECKEWR